MLKKSFIDNWKVKGDGIKERILTLPHDASMENGRDKDAISAKNGAYYKSGKYVYEKVITPNDDWDNKQIYLVFEGVYPNAKVFLNDNLVGGCDYGYSKFLVPLDGLNIGKENTIKVLVDDSNHPNSRWYAGAGIYRPVWIMIGNKTHIKPNGLKITTKSIDPAIISIELDIQGSVTHDSINVDVISKNDNDKVIGKIISIEDVNENIVINYQIDNAKLWNVDNPNLYECHIKLMDSNTIIDEAKETFGIRTISWSNKGFFINGKSTLLKGGCIHHDNGVVGACSYAESEWRKVKILKDFGYNAIRSAHNPMCDSLLEACDTLGMYVLDESWDTWYKTKNPHDFGNGFYDRYEIDLEQMVAKDYNHPSVIMYSIGNEVTEPASRKGLKLTSTLVNKMHLLDDTRPVTAGINITLLILAKLPIDIMSLFAKKATNNKDKNKEDNQEVNSEKFNQMMAAAGNGMNNVNAGLNGDLASYKVFSKLDIAGYNYGIARYEKEGKKHPKRVIVGTETYCQDIGRTWPMVEKLPYIIGDFMWTSWDHLGEVGIGGYSYDKEDFTFDKKYPWKLSNAGAIDILGNDTAEAGLAKVAFNHKTTPYIGVTPANHPNKEVAMAVWRGTNALPNWSYNGCDGNEVTVEVYSDSDSVELFVNGKSYGTKKIVDYVAKYSLNYEYGEIKAVSYNADGVKIGESSLHSAKPDELDIVIKKEDNYYHNANNDSNKIIYFDISIADRNGIIDLNSNRKLTAKVIGGELLGFGSANPKTEEEFTTGSYTTYLGKAQAVVRKTEDNSEIIISDDDGNKVNLKF